jgi:hypothetical protein
MECYLVVSGCFVIPDQIVSHLFGRHGCEPAGSQRALTPYTPKRMKP